MLMSIIFLCLLALVLSVANKFIKVTFFNFNEQYSPKKKNEAREMDIQEMNTNNAGHYVVKLRYELRPIYENHQRRIIS